jgi:hypothetical protein
MAISAEIDFNAPIQPGVDRIPQKCSSCDRRFISSDSNVECMECFNILLTRYEFFEQAEWLESLTYPQYLRSEHWKQIRETKLEENGRKCAVCASTVLLQVHHVEYPAKRIDVKANQLVVLCKRCHESLHVGGR